MLSSQKLFCYKLSTLALIAANYLGHYPIEGALDDHFVFIPVEMVK